MYGWNINNGIVESRLDILCTTVILDTFITLWILFVIHSFLCACITYSIIDELDKNEWKNIKNWRQTVEQSDVSGCCEHCVW